MAEPEANLNPIPRRQTTANKRTTHQKVADLQFIEKYALRGRTLRQIADLLAKERDYTISHAQVGADLKKLKELWLADAKEMVGMEKTKELRKLDIIEGEAWDAWDKSKLSASRTSVTRRSAGKGEGSGAGSEIKSAVQTSTAGDPVFLSKILDVHDRRSKLLGLAAPVKTEFSGPEGGPIATVSVNAPLTDEAQEAILERHFMRQAKKNAGLAFNESATTGTQDPA